MTRRWMSLLVFASACAGSSATTTTATTAAAPNRVDGAAWPDEGPATWAPRPTETAITANDLRTRLYQFADDSMKGRRIGEPGNYTAVMSSRLAGVVARAAGVDPEAKWEIQIPATSLLAIVIAVLGLFLAVTRGAEAVRTLALQFAANAGGTTVVRSAAMQTRPVSEIIANLVCIGAGIFLARKCASIAAWILPGADPV